MKRLVLVAALIAAPLASAGELDRQAFPADQIEKSKALPGTTVIRISQTDPNDVAVAYVKERLKPGQKGENLVFEKVALNQEKTGIAFSSKNELDRQSSTSSWVIGWRGPWGGGVAAGGWNRGWYGGGYYRPYYSNYYGNYYNNGYYPSYGYGYANYSSCGNYCYPSYGYGGYNYGYTPYYQYSGYGYNYYNCGWVY